MHNFFNFFEKDMTENPLTLFVHTGCTESFIVDTHIDRLNISYHFIIQTDLESIQCDNIYMIMKLKYTRNELITKKITSKLT